MDTSPATSFPRTTSLVGMSSSAIAINLEKDEKAAPCSSSSPVEAENNEERAITGIRVSFSNKPPFRKRTMILIYRGNH